MQVSDEEWVKWNKQGFIPGPAETQEAFLARVNYCLDLQNEMVSPAGVSDQIAQEAALFTLKHYDFYPEWVPLGFSNEKLALWHGGCAWIFQTNEQSPTGACMQLRKEFATKKKLWGLYDRGELIAHEMCHVARMMFEEPKYEEFLAYQISLSPCRRRLGALIQSAVESMLLLLTLALVIALDLYTLFVDSNAYELALYSHIIPFALLGFGLFRLGKREGSFNKCRNVLSLLVDREKVEAVIFRLTDKEIVLFGNSSTDEIIAYAAAQKCCRWQLLHSVYFKQGCFAACTSSSRFTGVV